MTPAEQDYLEWWKAQRAAQETWDAITALSRKYEAQAQQERINWELYARHLKKAGA